MDLVRRDALLARIGDVNEKTENLPLVTLEEFFVGNDDGASIWCNFLNGPTPDKVYGILKGIRDRQDVADVRILVTQFDGGEEDWPFSDTVYFITSCSEAEVLSWIGDEYAPDEIESGASFGRAESVPVPKGMQVIYAWWD